MTLVPLLSSSVPAQPRWETGRGSLGVRAVSDAGGLRPRWPRWLGPVRAQRGHLDWRGQRPQKKGGRYTN